MRYRTRPRGNLMSNIEDAHESSQQPTDHGVRLAMHQDVNSRILYTTLHGEYTAQVTVLAQGRQPTKAIAAITSLGLFPEQ